MFQFPSFATPGLCIQPEATSTLLDVGFPIRRSTGQRLYTAHRRFSQFYHVLLRLLVPRHPPNALTSLTAGTLAPLQLSRDSLESLRHEAKPSTIAVLRRHAGLERDASHQRRLFLSLWTSRSSTISLLTLMSSPPHFAGHFSADELIRASHFVHLFNCHRLQPFRSARQSGPGKI